MSTIDQIDKVIRDGNKDDGKRGKYITGLKQNPEFQEYVVEPIKKGLAEIKNIDNIDVTQDAVELKSQINGQKISHEYLTLLLSFFLNDDTK